MKDQSHKAAISNRTRQTLLIALILGAGLLLGVLILTTEAAAPEADGHGHGHAEASGHADEEHHEDEAGDHAGGAHQEGEVELTEAQIKAAGITLATAQPARIQSRIELPGEIVFNADRTATVVPRLAGVVETVLADLGAQVQKGQVLAVIASPELAERRSALAAAQRRLALARTTYEREKSLWEEQISAKQDYLQAQQALHEAELAVANAREQLQAFGADAGEPGRLSRYEIRAPFDGMVIEKNVTLGESVSADAKLFRISDLSTVWADIAVPARALGVVRVGGKATVKATAFDSNAEGTITYVGSLVGQQTRAAKARITLPNPGGVWRPGLFVTVQVVAGDAQVPVTVAPEAVHTLEEQPVVFIRDDHGFFAQPVTLGRRDAQAVEIVQGLQAGTRYALGNSFVIKSELDKDSAAHSH